MIMQWDNDSSAYEAVAKAVLDKYSDLNDSFVVQLREKHLYDENWHERTELLLNDGYDWAHPDYIWEADWWEGEPYVELIAAAPISDVKLQDEYKI